MLYPIDTPTRETKSLDGLWQIAIDKTRVGKDEAWYQAAPAATIEVAVPGSINEQLVDRELYTYMDWVWYFRDFFVPASWATGKRIFVHFGSATHRAEVYCNGKYLGSHEGGFTSFEFEITGAVIAGEKNRLSVRIDNLLDETTIPQGNLDPSVGGVAATRPGDFPNVHYDVFPYMGIHRSVTLHATGESHLEKLFITTAAIEKTGVTAQFQLRFSGDPDSAEIAIAELGFSAQVGIHDNRSEVEPAIAGAEMWSPESPKLYDVEVTTRKENQAPDIYTIPFGFKTIEVREEKLSQSHREHLTEFIERDFNHPLVIIWSLGNECESMDENGKGYFCDKVTFARTLDTSRPIIFVLNSTFETELEADCFDLIAINMYRSWYSLYGQFERIEEELRPQIEGFRDRFHKPILIAEFGADTIPGLHDAHALMWTEEFQVEMLQRIIEISEEYPCVIGTHVWNFSDFKVGQHVTRPVMIWKGVFTRDRHPKMAAHLLRRLWTNIDSDHHTN